LNMSVTRCNGCPESGKLFIFPALVALPAVSG
jgi:hypothetical protein